ncbi:hypothetical protein AHAS_Ahas04G0227400 [Arachis hypogaea]
MEATKTSFHTEIGSSGVVTDSVGELGELMAIKEEAVSLPSSPIESGSTPAEPISVCKLILNKPALHEEESSKREEKDDICALVKGFQEMFRTMKMLGFIQPFHGPKHFSEAFN